MSGMYRNYVRLTSVLWFITILSSCTQNVRPVTREYLGKERVFSKNYEIGQMMSAYVGEPIVKVKDYRVDRYKAKYMRASDDFTISGGIVTITGDKNTDYPVQGEVTIDGETYTVVSLPGSQQIGTGYGALIKSDGSVHNKLLNNNIIMIYSFSTKPSNLRFIPSKDEEINIGAGYLNYELIYSGTDGKSFTITYREYTSDDLARPAFYQNLVYEYGQGQIRFRDTVISIHEATNEKITYTVISDGLD